MKKHWLLGTLLGAIALPSFAVDGYKDIKFGMSFDQVKRSKFCETYWTQTNKLQDGNISYTCLKFRIDNRTPYPLVVSLFKDKVYSIHLELFNKISNNDFDFPSIMQELTQNLESQYGKPEIDRDRNLVSFPKEFIYLSGSESNNKFSITLSFDTNFGFNNHRDTPVLLDIIK